MKLKINTNILLNFLNNVSIALSTRNIIPFLNGIKFTLTKKGLSLLASNDKIIIQDFIPKKNITTIENEGSIVIPGKYILEIIRKLPNTEIYIENDGFRIILKTKNGEYKVNGLNASDYPVYNLQLNPNPIVLKSKLLKKAINQTTFAVSEQETRPILTGLNFKLSNNKLTITATDSYRLAIKTLNVSSSNKTTINLTIPGQNLIELNKIITENDQEIEIHLFNNLVLFKKGSLLFQTRVLNGTYPNVEHFIPTSCKHKIIVKRQEIYETIDRVSLVIDKEKNIIQLQGDNNKIIIFGGCDEIGNTKEEIITSSVLENSFQIFFNYKFMLDALKSFDSEEIEIQINGELKPIYLKSKTNNDLKQLIVPIKTI